MHIELMTELLERAIDRIRSLPPETKDDLARVLLRLAGHDEPVYQLTAEEAADLDEADAEIERCSLATNEEVRAVFSKCAV